ncbi:MAG: FMN-binding protein, partial [Clostridiales bacterium]|nr:FMN-binding protein [Clostridiales bacterium]
SALLDSIINKQSTNVDTVSGATYSSVGLINAVRNALAQAAVSETAVSEAETVAVVSTANSSASTSSPGTSSAASEVSDAAAYKDGTYYGSATGFAGTVTVKVVIEDGKIVSITIVSHSDGSSYMSKASALLDSIINKQSTNVDTVSGATYSSVGLINAVRNALAQAAVSETAVSEAETVAAVSTADSSVSNSSSGTSSAATEASDGTSGNFPYPDGTYYGTGEGFGGDITVAVVIKDQTIESVTIVSAEDETPAYFAQAEVLADAVVTAQSADLDVVSGATYSSEGILEAVKNALAAAKAAAEAENASSGSDTDGSSGESGSSSESTGNAGESDGSDESENSGSSSGTAGDSDDAEEGSDNGENSGSSADDGSDDSTDNGSTQMYADGTYTVTVACNPDEDGDFDAYNLTAVVTIEGDKIVSIEVSGDGDSDNDTYINRAANGTSKLAGVVTQIVALAEVTESSVGEVDTVSRATCSSVSIKEACQEALRQAAAAQASAANSSDSVSAAALAAALKEDDE